MKKSAIPFSKGDLRQQGISGTNLTPPGTPQWNGVSERRNRTLLDMVRSMMSHSDLPISFWGHALQTAAFTLNRVTSKSVQKTPYEIWTGKRPKVQQQQVTEPEVEQTSQIVEENSTNLETQPLRRATRERYEPERYGFLVTSHGDVILVDQDEPKTYQEAVSSLDSEKWLVAIRSEMDSMSNNQVWTLVEPPEGIKPIGWKWVFNKKPDMDGNVQTYKGRLVAKGFRQINGIDYDETFSHVAMFKSIRILFATAAFQDYEIWQMDVKTTFLNRKLEEDVYMTQPEGFVTLENAGKVCKLQRSIYGLKQASRSWNLRFNDAIKEFGFIRNEDEPCVYKRVSGSIMSFLILYVDDILIIGNDIPTLQSIKTWLSSCFSMKDLGEAAYILGVKIYRDRSRRILGLSQSTYIDKVLKRFSMEESKRGFLPTMHGISLSKEMCPSSPQERERISKFPYASAIGSIMYGMICTRPALSYALSMTSRYQANPAASEAAKEAVSIKKFVTELGVVPSISDAVELYCDNNGAIAQAKEPRSHQRSKHILRRFHLIREIIDRGDVEICKVHTDDNIADPLTKPLTQQKHDRHTKSLGIRYEERVFESEVVDWAEELDTSRSSRVGEKICSRFAAYQGTQYEPAANTPRADKENFKKHMDDMADVRCLMLATMNSELQKQHENMVAYEMIQNLKEIYEGQARQERYETLKALFQCKMTEGTPVGAHVIKMMGYIQTLEKLGFSLKDELATDLILQSLPDSFKPFVLNFNMNEINKTLPHSPRSEKKRKEKKVAKSKGNGKTKAKGKNALKPKDGISKDGKCFHCEKSGHWKRNCHVYLEEVKKAKAVGASVSDRGGEYLSQDFDELLKECGIVSQLTPPGTPQWNGVSERRNQNLLDMVRSMMSHSDLLISFWGHALETAAFTLNRVPSKSVQKTP
ncbi:hypothetical protein V6N12_067899 [Hibiscus sabdariffa]|uniref:Uncharacterized protein n=1 Tax=Hibiscus sabdariffa TaxID=183260 RepID=A0ABR2FNG9_9ROSI